MPDWDFRDFGVFVPGNPCKECAPPRRNATCHASCKDYLEYSKKVTKKRKMVHEKSGIEYHLYSMSLKGSKNRF